MKHITTIDTQGKERKSVNINININMKRTTIGKQCKHTYFVRVVAIEQSWDVHIGKHGDAGRYTIDNDHIAVM